MTSNNRIVRLDTVKAMTGLSRSTIYERVSDGSFPQKVKLGARSVGWVESEVEGWIAKAIDGRNQAEVSKPTP